MKAWLVRWAPVSSGEHEFVTILSESLDADTVRCRVEQLHTDLTASIAEKLEYARSPNPARLRDEANLSRGVDGRMFIECGDNPLLEARLVTDLHVETNEEDGSEVLHYVDGKQTSSVTSNWLDGIQKVPRSSLSLGGVADDQ